MQKGIFSLAPIKPNDDLEMLHHCVFLYSCYRKMTGKVSNPLAHKPTVLLSLYLQKGINPETKKIAKKFFKASDKYMNSLNYTLRQGGYLEKDRFNERKSNLNPTLEKLREYYLDDPKTVAYFMMSFKLDYGK